MAGFERTAASLKNFGESAKGLVGGVQNAFSTTFAGGKSQGGRMGRAVVGVADFVGSTAVTLARWPVSATGFVARKAPVLTTLGVISVGAIGLTKVLNNRAEREAANNSANPFPAGPQDAAAQASAYTVTPEECDLMNARMRQGGQGQNFSAAVQADRANAAAAAPAV